MRFFLAILVGKLISFITKTLHIGGGSAAPGLYALKIEPDLVRKLAGRIKKNVIITGTNGKTTTARILALLATESNLKVIRNHTGSNLERGIASALINKISWGWKLFNPGGWIDSHIGIWELDEAAFNSVAPKLNPDTVVFLNIFRDQMDRYGEIDSVVQRWSETIKELPTSTIILLNGDDKNTFKLKKYFKGKVETFGVENFKIVGESLEKSAHRKLNFEAKNIRQEGLMGSHFKLEIRKLELKIDIPIPGIYHIYDTVAALSAASCLDLPIHKLTGALKNFQPAFGRFEKFTLQPGRLQAKQLAYIFLIKNPAGATQVFKTIAPQLKAEDRLLIALNDNLADGTDVSWIWDVNFELLQNSSRAKSRDYLFYVSGTRAYDLAVRLKYAGFDPKSIHIETNIKNALKEARRGLKGSLFILPTYTSLLELQKTLTKQRFIQPYWQQN